MDQVSFKDTQAKQVLTPIAECPVLWEFKPFESMAAPFYPLISEFGAQLLFELDELILDVPAKAAARATKLYQHYSMKSKSKHEDVREVMSHLAKNLKSVENLAANEPIMPEKSVFRGSARMG